MENIIFQYPSWYLILCLLLGIAYASILYFKENRFDENSKIIKWILALLRMLSVTLLAILLLSPLIKTLIENQKDPIILSLIDSSESIKLGSKKEENPDTAIDNLLTKLEEKYNVQKFYFGESVHAQSKDSVGNKTTNLSRAIKFASENYGDQNVGAVILSSDGIYNEGLDPIYQDNELNAPFYTLALGDTTKRKDLLIKDVFYNKIVYLGDQFNVQVDVAADNCSRQRTTLRVNEIQEDNSIGLKEQRINIDSDNFFTTEEVTLTANKAGIIKYRVAVNSIDGEEIRSNNVKEIYVEVLDARQKILLYADAPHPDISAIRSALSYNKNYELDLKYAGRDGFNPAEYDMVIFHNLPSKNNKILSVLDQLNSRKTSRLFVVGKQTILSELNEIQDVVKISGNNSQSDLVQAIYNGGFSSFLLDESIKNRLSNFPPMIAPFGKYEKGADAKIMLYQKIGRVATEYPLIGFNERNNIRTAVIASEGLWKWKLADFQLHQNHQTFNDLIGKIIQFTSVKKDTRKFRTNTSKNLFKENESIQIEAQLFNENFESINAPDVNLVLKDGQGKTYKYNFSRKDNFYSLDLGYLKQGNYSYSAECTSSGKLLKDKGSFTVKQIALEQFDLTARHQVLHRLSEKTGGKMFYLEGLESLQTQLLQSDTMKPILYTSNKTQSVLNIRWILGLLMLLLCLEWFVRRYFGSY